MTPIDKLKKLVNEANHPEGVPLEIGAEVSMGNSIFHVFCIEGLRYGLSTKNGYKTVFTKGEIKNLAGIELLGKPLEGFDVLNALNINSTDEKWVLKISANLLRIQYGEIVCILDLTTKPSEWPDETVEALIKLLN